METVNRLSNGRFPFAEVCLMAAAIDDFSLSGMDDYRGSVDRCDRVAVLSSKGDEALKFAYPAGDLLQAFSSFGAKERDWRLAITGRENPERGSLSLITSSMNGFQKPRTRIMKIICRILYLEPINRRSLNKEINSPLQTLPTR